jgi:hypothetical protein
MNPELSEQQIQTALYVLYKGFVTIRLAGRAGDTEKCWAISDALHNLPNLIADGRESMGEFIQRDLFAHVEGYPEVRDWVHMLWQAGEKPPPSWPGA